MKSYKDLIKTLSEKVDPTECCTHGTIDVDYHAVRCNINRYLSQATAHCSVTPHAALEKINKILASFQIFLPQPPHTDGDHGVHVFHITQFYAMTGMKNDGSVVTKTESPYHLFFEWKRDDYGSFDIFAEIVTDEELKEIMDDIADNDSDNDTNLSEGSNPGAKAKHREDLEKMVAKWRKKNKMKVGDTVIAKGANIKKKNLTDKAKRLVGKTLEEALTEAAKILSKRNN